MKVLRTLFSCTQTKQAKVLGAWVLIPGCLAMANKELWTLAVMTNELVHSMTFWQSFPYIAACATVFATAGCFKMVATQIRREHPLFKSMGKPGL